MKLLLVVAALLSFNTYADSFEFECTGSDLVYVDSFSMNGVVDTNDNTIVYDVSTREAGNNGSLEALSDVVRENAKFERLTDPVTGDFMGYRAYSVDKNDKHIYVNILMDYAGKLTSQIRNSNGKVFRSTCKSL